MSETKTYQVNVSFEVSANSETEAIKFFVDDVVECFKNGTLDATVEEAKLSSSTSQTHSKKRFLAYIWSDSEMVLGENIEKQGFCTGSYVVLDSFIEAATEDEALSILLNDYELDEDEIYLVELKH